MAALLGPPSPSPAAGMVDEGAPLAAALGPCACTLCCVWCLLCLCAPRVALSCRVCRWGCEALPMDTTPASPPEPDEGSASKLTVDDDT